MHSLDPNESFDERVTSITSLGMIKDDFHALDSVAYHLSNCSPVLLCDMKLDYCL